MDVQSAADDAGLPMLVVLDPFNLVWQRLPGRAGKVGVRKSPPTALSSQGSMAVTVQTVVLTATGGIAGASDGHGIRDYKLQVGDLDNRSSLRFIDPKGIL